jgi:hypothetical protein
MRRASVNRNDVAELFAGSEWLRELSSSIHGLGSARRELLNSVVTECRQYGKLAEPRSSPVRIVHHFACTGGTLISRALQAQPNTLVLSEVDPFSTIPRDYKSSKFAPSDMIFSARVGHYDIDNDLIASMFIAELNVLYDKLERSGRRLIVRAHSHSQFCTNVLWSARPTVQQVIESSF